MINLLNNTINFLYGDHNTNVDHKGHLPDATKTDIFHEINLSQLDPDQKKEKCGHCRSKLYSQKNNKTSEMSENKTSVGETSQNKAIGIYHYPNEGNEKLKHIFHKACFSDLGEVKKWHCIICNIKVKNREDFVHIKTNWKRVAAVVAMYSTIMISHTIHEKLNGITDQTPTKEDISVVFGIIFMSYIKGQLDNNVIEIEESKLLTKQLTCVTAMTVTTAALSTFVVQFLSNQAEESEGWKSRVEWAESVSYNIALMAGTTALGNVAFNLAHRVFNKVFNR